MSHVNPHDPGTPGYFLPEDGQSRLRQLRDHVALLSRLAQARTPEGGEGAGQHVTAAELETCLALLAEQADRVLVGMTWWPGLPDATDTPRPAPAGPSAGRYAYGVTVDQFDALDRLVETLSAHGDVIAVGNHDELAHATLPRLGQAIFDGAQAMRDLLDQMEAQGLGKAKGTRIGVGETRGTYGIERPDDALCGQAPLSTPPELAPVCKGRGAWVH